MKAFRKREREGEKKGGGGREGEGEGEREYNDQPRRIQATVESEKQQHTERKVRSIEDSRTI